MEKSGPNLSVLEEGEEVEKGQEEEEVVVAEGEDPRPWRNLSARASRRLTTSCPRSREDPLLRQR